MFFLALLATLSTAETPIYGVAQAGDGDSLTIGSERMRLFGIDAPEFDQSCRGPSGTYACGKHSADQLSSLVTGRTIRCVPVAKDQYDRTLARCYLQGTEINRVMVASGYAIAYRRYSLDYVSAEETARRNKRGLWIGTFQNPAEYRGELRGERDVSLEKRSATTRSQSARRATPRTARGCAIKGNHSRRGEWIYHLPGMPYYDQTRPEAIFCTEAQALAAGYRRAKVH
jgi:endonuclease YncB( thermonuclease family)